MKAVGYVERCGHNFAPLECPYDECGYREALQQLKAERERCARLAGDASIEQDEAGHTRNGDTWMAACAYVRAKIKGIAGGSAVLVSRADLIREDAVLNERERCAKIADAMSTQCSSSAPCCNCADEIAAKIREGQ